MSGRATAAIVLVAVFFAGTAVTLGVLRVVEHRSGPLRRDPPVHRFPTTSDRGPAGDPATWRTPSVSWTGPAAATRS